MTDGKHSCGGRKAGTGGHTMLGESPCDKCLRGIDYCKQNELACSDYLYYIKKGKVIKRSRAPTAGCYLRMKSRGKTKHEQKIRTGPEKGRTQEESRAQKESLQAQSTSQEKSRKAQSTGETQSASKETLTRTKTKSVTQIIVNEGGIFSLIKKEISAKTQGSRTKLLIIT